MKTLRFSCDILISSILKNWTIFAILTRYRTLLFRFVTLKYFEYLIFIFINKRKEIIALMGFKGINKSHFTLHAMHTGIL